MPESKAKLRERDLRGLRYMEVLVPPLDRLRDVGCGRAAVSLEDAALHP
ncbi:MAG: hypothetical protein JSS27_02400 [Planctomycetes bacterium]|nr:hypothetical protein [Planctomycetota bacterium]